MAVTKILTRKGRLDIGINYVLNGDKTEERVLTTHLNCDPGREFRQMLDTKRAVGKEDGVQYYHIIQSFKPGEVTPEQALEIATEFAKEHLPGYETVIGVHVDKEHIHAHLVFNSVNADTGEKYHSNAKSYYRQIRAIFLLMEHMGYEISHGNRLGFRLRGQERFMIPGRKNALFTEDGIRATIQGNLAAIEVGRRPAVLPRPQYRPYQKHPKYTGFLALYVHYLYLLGKTGKRQYPPRMTPQLRQEVMRFEQYREQFSFLRDNNITTQADMATFTARTEEMLANLMKQRTVLNVRKKRHRALYTALADAEALAPARELYEAGLSGMEAEFARYMDAVAALEQCGVPREGLIQEKAELYDRLAELNRQIRAERRKLALCRKTQNSLPRMEQEIDKAEARESEVRTNEHRRR